MSGVKLTLRVAVVGASSLIGEALIAELRARKFPLAELHALEDERNIGRPLSGEGGAEARNSRSPMLRRSISRARISCFSADGRPWPSAMPKPRPRTPG